MIEIKMMTEAAFKTLQNQSEEVAKMINDHPSDSTWLKDYLGFEPYEIKKYEVEDFSLTDDDSENGQFENGVVLYEHLKELPKYIICDNRFWAWVLFDKGYKLAQKLIKPTASTIVSRWVPNTARRSLMLNVIGRLFFKVDVSINDSLENQYELTQYVFSHHNIYKNLVMRNIGSLKNVSLAVLQVHKEVHDKYPDFVFNDDVDSPLLNEASKIGSVKLIDTVSKEEVYETLRSKFETIVLNV